MGSHIQSFIQAIVGYTVLFESRSDHDGRPFKCHVSTSDVRVRQTVGASSGTTSHAAATISSKRQILPVRAPFVSDPALRAGRVQCPPGRDLRPTLPLLLGLCHCSLVKILDYWVIPVRILSIYWSTGDNVSLSKVLFTATSPNIQLFLIFVIFSFGSDSPCIHF